MRITTLWAALVLSVLAFAPSHAVCPSAPCAADATDLLVREHCGDLPNCFESMATLTGRSDSDCEELALNPALAHGERVPFPGCETNGWLWDVSTADHVVIDVGPGTFEPFVCPTDPAGDPPILLVRGSGRGQTILLGDDRMLAGEAVGRIGIDVFNCRNLVFSHLRSEGVIHGARWMGHGNAVWSHVAIVGNPALTTPPHPWTAAWRDRCQDGTAELSSHDVYDTDMSVVGAAYASWAYLSDCAETYMFEGGTFDRTPSPGFSAEASVLRVAESLPAPPEPPSFTGVDVRVVSEKFELNTGERAVGVEADGSATVLLVGSGIDVEVRGATGQTPDATGVLTSGGAVVTRIHTPIDASAPGTALDEEP